MISNHESGNNHLSSRTTKRTLSRARHFSPNLVSSARGCLRKKDDTKYRWCVAIRKEGKKTIEKRRGKKKGEKERTMRRVSTRPINFFLQLFLSAYAQLCFWMKRDVPKGELLSLPPFSSPTMVYTRAEWPFTVVRDRDDSWKPTLSFE